MNDQQHRMRITPRLISQNKGYERPSSAGLVSRQLRFRDFVKLTEAVVPMVPSVIFRMAKPLPNDGNFSDADLEMTIEKYVTAEEMLTLPIGRQVRQDIVTFGLGGNPNRGYPALASPPLVFRFGGDDVDYEMCRIVRVVALSPSVDDLKTLLFDVPIKGVEEFGNLEDFNKGVEAYKALQSILQQTKRGYDQFMLGRDKEFVIRFADENGNEDEVGINLDGSPFEADYDNYGIFGLHVKPSKRGIST
jgi:hypothetical protein